MVLKHATHQVICAILGYKVPHFIASNTANHTVICHTSFAAYNSVEFSNEFFCVAGARSIANDRRYSAFYFTMR
ncbi:hypothetical protein HMPREF9420_1332 [Segatella salivae DSM 15606]|uniref:Uncharacterized protein n=1 Tax=Segatella salivae DSM 15606 TaxID=888832 RepID=E6MPB4_9BACT|nr:hypothetical protein HMPREF9420_1332 [Segatella salivae DSM 15606]